MSKQAICGHGEGFGEGVDEGDFAGEMGHIQRLGLTKLGHHFGCDEAVLLQVDSAKNDAMADGGDGVGAELFGDISGDGLGGVVVGFRRGLAVDLRWLIRRVWRRVGRRDCRCVRPGR